MIEQRAQKGSRGEEKTVEKSRKSGRIKLFPLKQSQRNGNQGRKSGAIYGEKKVTGPLNFEVKNGEQVILRGKMDVENQVC